MPILFPSLKPSTRSFTAPDYPVTSPEYVRGVAYPRLRGNQPVNAQLQLTFSNITDAEATSILNAYALSRSGFHPLTMPIEIVSGIDLQALKDRVRLNSTLRWHFNDPPKVDAGIPGISTVNVTLVATLSPEQATRTELLTVSAGNFALNGRNVGLNEFIYANVLGASAGNFALSGQTVSFNDLNFASVSLLLPMDGTDGATTFTDKSPNALTVSRVGTTTTISTSQFKYGGASATFNGATGNYLTVPTAGNQFNFGSGDFTIEAWIRPSTITGNQSICSIWPADSIASWRFLTVGNTLQLLYRATDNTSDGIGSSGVITTNNWHHIVGVRAGNTLLIYVDGVQAGSGAITKTIRDAQSTLSIGRNEDSNTWYYNGFIDDLRITKGIARYPVNFTRPTVAFSSSDPNFTNVSLLLPMNGTNNGTVFTDISNNTHAITPFGNAKTSTDLFQFGGSSGAFDGDGDYLSAPNNTTSLDISGDFTIELWMYMNSYKDGVLVSSSASTQNNAQMIRVNYSGNGTMLVYLDNNQGALGILIDVSTTNTVTTNTWHHIALSRANGIARLFVDGTQKGIKTGWTTGFRVDVIGTLFNSGVLNTTLFYDGYIDDVRITKGIGRYTGNFTPPTTPFWYPPP